MWPAEARSSISMLREGPCSALYIKWLILAHICRVFFSGTELPFSKVQADTKQDYFEFSSPDDIWTTGNSADYFKLQVLNPSDGRATAFRGCLHCPATNSSG